MKIPPEVVDVLRVAAPTLLGALGGPAGVVAAAAATAALDQWLPSRQGDRPATPQELVNAVQANASDTELRLALARAEFALKAYELEMRKVDAEYELAALEVDDRRDARALAASLTASGSPQGWAPTVLSVLIVMGFFGTLTFFVMRPFAIDPAQRELLALMLGALTLAFGDVRSFWLGSSASSKAKTDALASQAERAVVALGERAAAAPLPLPPPAAPPSVVMVPPLAPPPASPAPPMPAYTGDWHQGPFGGLRWRLTPGGVVPEGQTAPMRTVGQPATVRRIWNDFGPLIAASCAANGVPLEIAVACIAVESRGKPAAVLVEPDGRQSVGLFQTLIGTASEVMGREVTAEELSRPEVGIEAGVRYLAKMRPKSGYQPPLAAACHNAGGLYPPREQDNNPWRLRSTGDHISRFCQFFGDCCAVAAEDGWSHADARSQQSA